MTDQADCWRLLPRGGQCVKECGVMPRTPPSAADQDLIHALGVHGIKVTPFQLERWRQHGLLPRPTVMRQGQTGSTVVEHGEATRYAAALLGRYARRGSPWQDLVDVLILNRCTVAQESLQKATEWVVRKPGRRLARLWSEAVQGLPADFRLDRDRLLQVADLVVELADRDRGMRRELALVTREITAANYIQNPDDIARAARVALGLRIALLGGAQLPRQFHALARYGIDFPPLHEAIQFALPYEKAAAARSMTHAEAQIMVDFWLGLDELDALTSEDRDRHFLEALATNVALRRMNSPPFYDAAKPLDPAGLESWDEWTRWRLKDIAAPQQDPLPFEDGDWMQ